jgi:hypothetical protein
MEEKKDKKELVRQEILLGEKAAATQSGEDQPGEKAGQRWGAKEEDGKAEGRERKEES